MLATLHVVQLQNVLHAEHVMPLLLLDASQCMTIHEVHMMLASTPRSFLQHLQVLTSHVHLSQIIAQHKSHSSVHSIQIFSAHEEHFSLQSMHAERPQLHSCVCMLQQNAHSIFLTRGNFEREPKKLR